MGLLVALIIGVLSMASYHQSGISSIISFGETPFCF